MDPLISRMSSVEASQWQPIESAYTYENVAKKIIVMDATGSVTDAMMLSGSIMSKQIESTHWMPLIIPQPPTTEL